ncbi:MAG: hypothetical protein U0R19_29455 [Bryobacteraceae bacterium]
MANSSGDLLEQAVQHVSSGRRISTVGHIGDLSLPSDSSEYKRCQEIKEILEDYSQRQEVAGPLSIAVFGPPGSGKSYCVKNLIKSFNTEKLDDQTINLSQVPDLQGLSEQLKAKLNPGGAGPEVKEAGKPPKTHILFLDEFDAPLAGEPLGWLRWFLALMQDGTFLDNGKPVKCKKAILFFAGGTAPSLDEFERRAALDEAEFRAKKVPDFISRLRGFIDIQGVNATDAERPVRRALVLRGLLQGRWPERANGGEFPIDDSLTRKLLTTAHYVHGVRSMTALLDTSRLASGETLSETNLPSNDLRRLHVSRGPLDGKVIVVSAGLRDERPLPLLAELTETLLANGATLSYGGDFVPGGTFETVVSAARRVPDGLIQRDAPRLRNYLGFPSFHSPIVADLHRLSNGLVEFIKLETLSPFELDELALPHSDWFSALPSGTAKYQPRHHLGWAISLFRMRVRMCQDADALIVLGGKDESSWGRFSGIAEEVMLAIALRKPLYLLGGCGGATKSVGSLLGIDATIANPDCLLYDPGPIRPTSFPTDSWFQIPGLPSLPVTVKELRSWLRDRSVWTDAWPWNGLNTDENRSLFSAPLPASKHTWHVQTILGGLLRLDWKPRKQE